MPPRLGETFSDKFADQWPAFIWPKAKVVYYIFSVGYLALIVAGMIVMALRGGASLSQDASQTVHYLPMQKVLKMRFRMSSVVVAPVMASSGRSAL